MTLKTEYWRLLGLKPGDYVELNRGWKYFAKEFHPDLGGTNESYIEAKNAYDFLIKEKENLKRIKNLKKVIKITLEDLHYGKKINLHHGQDLVEISMPSGGFINNYYSISMDNLKIELYFELIEHPVFKIRNGLLTTCCEVNALDLLLDEKIYFNTLVGNKILCCNNALRQSNTLVFKNQGVRYLNTVLDLQIEVKFVFPQLDSLKIAEIKECLNLR